MRRSSKLLSLLMAVLMGVTILSGCGGNAEEVAETTAEAEETTVVEEVTEEPVTEEPTVDTLANKDAALEAANSCLRVMAFSYNGLVRYLQEFEGFTEDEAVYAVDNCGADWNEQAVKHAQYYLNTQSFTRDELIGQLEYEGYTTEQAIYGVDGVGLK